MSPRSRLSNHILHRAFEILNYIPWLILVVLGVISFVALPWTLGLPVGSVAATGAVLMLGTAWLSRQALSWPNEPTAADAVTPKPVVWIVIAAGLLLRWAYLILIPSVQLSDMADYVMLANRLLADGSYHQTLYGQEVYAYRPPGYAFLLAGAFWLTGGAWWAPSAINLVCFVLSVLVLNDLVARLAGERAALFAISLLSFWPSGIFSTGLALNEWVSLLLLLVVAWASVRAHSSSDARWVWLTGLSMGAGALVRPSLLPLPLLLLVLSSINGPARRHVLRHAALSLAVAALVVAPWTLRNYARFHSVVMVSANGGDVLYRANNPLASGGFTPKGEKSFIHLLPDEVAWSKASSDAAKAWIVENPLAFVRLSFRRAAIFMGDDSTGAYWSLERAHGITGWSYKLAIAASNAWWVLVWVLALVALLRRRAQLVDDPRYAVVMWLAVILPAVHVIFEAQPRYHMPMVGVLLCVAASLFGWREPADDPP